MDLNSLIRHCRTTVHNTAIGRAPSPYHAAAQVMWDPATKSFSWQAVAFDPKSPGAVPEPRTPDVSSSKRRCRNRDSEVSTTTRREQVWMSLSSLLIPAVRLPN